MKTSYLLNILVASLKNITKVIAKTPHNIFVTELVIDNYRSIYDDLCKMTDKDAEDEFVTRNFYKDYVSKKMDYYTANKNIFTREQYIAEVRQLIDKTIDNAARLGFCIEEEDITDDSLTPDDTQPAPAAITDDNTPDSSAELPQLCKKDTAKMLRLLQNIADNIKKLIAIFERCY